MSEADPTLPLTHDQYYTARRYYIDCLGDYYNLKDKRVIRNPRYQRVLDKQIRNCQKLAHCLDVINHATDETYLSWITHKDKVKMANEILQLFDYKGTLASFRSSYNVLGLHLQKLGVGE